MIKRATCAAASLFKILRACACTLSLSLGWREVIAADNACRARLAAEAAARAQAARAPRPAAPPRGEAGNAARGLGAPLVRVKQEEPAEAAVAEHRCRTAADARGRELREAAAAAAAAAAARLERQQAEAVECALQEQREADACLARMQRELRALEKAVEAAAAARAEATERERARAEAEARAERERSAAAAARSESRLAARAAAERLEAEVTRRRRQRAAVAAEEQRLAAREAALGAMRVMDAAAAALARLRVQLPADAYEAVARALRAYDADGRAGRLADVVGLELAAPGREAPLATFRALVPADARARLDVVAAAAAAEQPDAPAAETATRWRKTDLLLAALAAAAPPTALAAPRFRFGKRSGAELDPTRCAACAAPRAFCASIDCVALLPCAHACVAAAAEEEVGNGYRVNCSICEEPPCAAFCARCFDPPPAREAEAGECQRCFWSGCEGCGGTRFDVFCCNASRTAGRQPGAVRGDCRDCAEEDPRCQDCDAFFGAPGPSSDGEGEYPSHYDGDDHDERNSVSIAVIDKFLQRCQRRRQEEEAEEEAEAAEIEAIAEAELDPALKGSARRRALEQARANLEFESRANRYH